MNVLITGAAGFLGSHLSARYLSQGHKVFGVDNFCTSLGRESAHFQLLLAHENFHFKEGDICDQRFMDDVCTWFRPKLILNFACPASPPKYQAMPIETTMTCVQGTKNVLDQAAYEHAIVVHASTSEVYGDPNVSPQPESYRGCVNSYGPRSCYDEGKRAAEALCYDYLHKKKVDARLVRIFNTYGPHMDPDDGRVVSNFVRQALKGEPLTVYGDGRQTRSFCYVDDLIDGICAMAALKTNPGTPINIGNPNEFTIWELSELVRKKIPGTRRVIESLPQDDPRQRKPDITVARELLNFEPKVQLVDGIDRTIDYFKKIVA